MYYQSSARPNDPAEPESDRLKTLLDNLNNLRGKLKNFTVIDELGQPIGEITDLILDAGHQLNLVIAQPDTQEQPSSVLLNGRRIKKVSVQTQSVFVDITKADVQYLPEYLLPDEPVPPQPIDEELSVDQISAPPPPAAVSPDFSLDVMEPPQEPIASTTTDTLDFLEFQEDTPSFGSANDTAADDLFELELPNDSTSLDTANDLFELETAADPLTLEAPTDLFELELPSDPSTSNAADDLFELELPNEARPLEEFTLADTPTSPPIEELEFANEAQSVEEFTLADTPTSPPAEELPDLSLAIDETVAANSEAEELPDLGFDSDTSSDVDDQWADFDRIMAIEPEQADPLNLNGSLDEPTAPSPVDNLAELDFGDVDANPLPEDFALEDLAPAEPAAELPPLPELSEINQEFDLPSVEFSSLELPSESSPEPSIDNLSALDFGDVDAQAEPPLTDLSFELEDHDTTNDLSFANPPEPSGDLPGLSFTDSELDSDLIDELAATDTFASLDFDQPTESPPADLSLSELDFDEPQPSVDSLDEIALSADEDLSALDLTLNTAQDDLVGDSDAIVFTEDGDETDADLETISSLADLDFTPESAEPAPLNFDEPDVAVGLDTSDLAASDLDTADNIESFSFDESAGLPDFSLESNPSTEFLSQAQPESALDFDLGESSSPAESALDFDLSESSSPAEPDLDFDLSESSNALPDLNLADLSPPAEDFNLDAASSLETGEPDGAPDFAVDLPAPPAINLDELELSSAPIPLPTNELSFIGDRPSGAEPATVEAGLTEPEFGLESIPAETYDLPGDEIAADLTATDDLQSVETVLTSDTVDAIVPLLEERLKVEYERRKVGEVVVRKRIETRMVQVPVRYEKLIIEQVGDDPKTLAEVDLSQGVLDNLEVPGATGSTLVSGEFKSARTASYVLDAIAKTLRHRCKKVRIEVELDDPKLQKAYQEWLDRCSQVQ
ncbi:MAG: YsnF/AvaK domain-containing protein [Leptolyngbyaceae cyanobacterium bins.302]|nr:YsnF/AvaK domain-containing protein [Leptolyngbyaceae cyanobacterium bins.302]